MEELEQNNILRENQRNRKKMTIIAIPIGIIVLMIALVVIFNLPNASCFDERQNGNETGIDCGGSCVACGIKYARNLEIIGEVSILEVTSDAIETIVRVRNPNTEYGVKFDYQVKFLDSFGQIKDTVNAQSFIYPSSAKYLVIPKIEGKKSEIVKAEVIFNEESFQWFASNKTSKDLFGVYDVQTQFLEDAKNPGYLKVVGKINNKMSYNFSSVNMTILVYSKIGELLNAVETQLDGLNSNTTEQFEYTWMTHFPNLQQTNLNRVEIYPDALME